MSTSAQVQAAWVTLFSNAVIQAITENAYGYEVTDTSESELSTFEYETKVNFFQYLVSREILGRVMGGAPNANVMFTVSVKYTLEKDTAGAAYQAARDAIETIVTVAENTLTQSWLNTIDYFNYQEGPPEITEITIGSTPCWQVEYKFYGFQEVTL